MSEHNAWDEGFEAGSTWNPSTPAGVPNDPPANPYPAAAEPPASPSAEAIAQDLFELHRAAGAKYWHELTHSERASWERVAHRVIDHRLEAAVQRPMATFPAPDPLVNTHIDFVAEFFATAHERVEDHADNHLLRRRLWNAISAANDFSMYHVERERARRHQQAVALAQLIRSTSIEISAADVDKVAEQLAAAGVRAPETDGGASS